MVEGHTGDIGKIVGIHRRPITGAQKLLKHKALVVVVHAIAGESPSTTGLRWLINMAQARKGVCPMSVVGFFGLAPGQWLLSVALSRAQ